jgi:hypothetical protein
MIERLKRMPLTWLTTILVLLPMVINAVRAWFSLPLEYGTTIGPGDPDTWMRLTLVRDWLSGGDWYSHAITHSDAPFGTTVSPWTRPLDMVIAFFTQLQPHSIDLSARLINTALILPIFWMGLLLAGIYRLVHTLCPLPSALPMAGVLVCLSIVMKNYFGTGNADHHAMLATLFVWALIGIIKPTPSKRETLASGLLLSLMLWVSPEALVLIAVVFGWYGLMWLTGASASAKPLPLLATTIAMSSTLALMIEQPSTEWLTPVYDSLSIVYVVILSLVAAIIWPLYAINPRTVKMRLLLASGGFLYAFLLMHYCYPLMLRGPMAEVDPFILTTFLPQITEVQPLFNASLYYCIAVLISPLAALTMLALARQHPSPIITRHHCLQLGYFLLAVLPLYLYQQRFSYYLYPLVAATLAPFLAALMSPEHPLVAKHWPALWLADRTPDAQAIRRLPILIAILGLPLLCVLVVPDNHTVQSKKVSACERTAKQLIQSGKLNDLVGTMPLNFLLPTNLGGDMLFFTPHHIVASNYHREGEGLRYVWEARDVTNATALRKYLAIRNIKALLICPDAKIKEESVLQGLQRGDAPPAWLEAVPYTLPPKKDTSQKEDEKEKVAGANPTLFLVR